MRAYAKVNLALSVGPPIPKGRPEAGYHPIASWMHAIDLFDDVEVEPLPAGNPNHYDIRWTPSAPVPSIVDWPLDQDLAVRAHRLLEAHTARRLPLSLSLIKRIPVGAGLGGGSSDAAAALMLINSAFALGLSMQDLVRLSRQLGTDVAFFLDDPPPRPAIVTGIGDRIERLDRTEGYLVLILPGFGCPTAEVYAAFDRLKPARLRERETRALATTRQFDSRALFNDLEIPAQSIRPELAALRHTLSDAAGSPVHMTGSGSALFIPCPEDSEARRLARTLAATLNGHATLLRARLI